MTKFPHSEQAFFITLNVFYLKKKNYFVYEVPFGFFPSFLLALQTNKQTNKQPNKLISTRCNSKKLSYPPLLIASLLEDVTFTVLNAETITGQKYSMNLQPWQANYSIPTPTTVTRLVVF